MSARLLKKVLKEQEAAEQENNSFNSSDESESPELSASAKNPFDLLDDHEDSEDDRAVEQGSELETLNQCEEQKHEGKQPSVPEIPVESVLTNKKSMQKKKKKKKNKQDTVSVTKDAEKSCNSMLESLTIGVESSQLHPVDDTCKKSKYANSNVSNNVLQLSRTSVLQIDPKHLSAENELRRIFGSKVVSSFERGLTTGTSRQTRGGRRGTHSHKRTILVSPSEHWPRWDGSISMEHLETNCGIHYFRYVHSSSYSQAQKVFEAAKAAHDLNGIANVLLHHPYHIESLITLSEYFQLLGEHHRSTDAIRQSLYGLECAWNPMFTPLQNNCQLKYEHEINRPFFTALFAHMKNMDRRGCHRSALEICKLLLSVDSDDPMGALFCIDYFALRAEEYSWLEQFSDEYGKNNSLWLFPNFCFSLAICRFYLEEKEKHENDTKKETGRASAADLMNQALLLHPTVLKKLVAKVPLKEKIWTGIVEHSHFKSEQTGNPSVDHLASIYVERSYLIWRLPDLQKFLKDSAQSVILTMKDNRSEANDWACVRNEAFPHEKNEYRHLLLSDFSDSTPSMPPENLQQFLVDPRAREFDNGQQVMMNHPPGGGGRAPVDLSDRNALAVFLESILPWIDYGREGDEDYQDDHHE